jgi:hypothetical protein
MDFAAYTEGLIRGCDATDGVDGLVLLGSASAAGAPRRDAWSDHDVYVLLADDRADELRASLAFLPFPERIVARAREGHLGFAVLYDDGHLIEFAAGTREELQVVRTGEHEVVLDTDDDALAAVVAATSGPRDDGELTAADHVTLALIKLMVGVGRGRRGERINANAFVRTYAVSHLVAAIRARVPPGGHAHDELDPVRRFEVDYAHIGKRMAGALDLRLEDAAHELVRLTRDALEPGWSDFPTAAADAVERRLGWSSDAG